MLSPTDRAAGGTWVGVNQRGVTLCLLNGNPRPYPELPPADLLTSRGAIIPALCGAADAASAVEQLSRLELARFAPFALLAVDLAKQDGAARPRVIRAQWDRNELGVQEYAAGPVCAVSSGLGDTRVTPRLELFEEMVASGAGGPGADAQDRFHRHVWRDRPEISVMMSRSDARTVSITTVEVVAARSATPARISMHYQPIRESGEFGDAVLHRFSLGTESLGGGARVVMGGRMAGAARSPIVAG